MLVPSLVLVASSLSLWTGPSGEGVTAEQFLRLIQSQQSQIRDVAFAFEGEGRSVDPGKGANAQPVQFQGRYALRADGATFLEHYFVYSDGRRDSHPLKAMIAGRGEAALITPAYLATPGSPVLKSASGPGSYFRPDSPETFSFLWRFQTLRGATDFGYKFIGWETVGGRRCARVEFSAHPNAASRVLQELWVDLERGGHPLRIRNSVGGASVYVIDQIVLDQFALPSGEKVWFPVGGRFNQFHREGKYARDPVHQTTSSILSDTLIFNQGLSDQVFQVKGEPFRPTFQGKRTAIAERINPVMDFEAADKKLDDALADPSRRGAVNDAAASARNEASRGYILFWGLGGLGLAALLGAGVVAIRR